MARWVRSNCKNRPPRLCWLLSVCFASGRSWPTSSRPDDDGRPPAPRSTDQVGDDASMGRPIRTFTVLPHLPERLQPLQKLAYNLWWCWNPEAISLFRRIDADLFEAVEHSPVKVLGGTDQARLEQLLADDGFLAHMDRVEERFETYMGGASWFDESFLPKFRA